MADRLKGKVALISGGARGQGATEGKLFAREGAKVVLGDVLEAEGMRTAEEVRTQGGEAVFVKLDVTKEDDWQRAVDTAVSRLRVLDTPVPAPELDEGSPGGEIRP